VIDAIGVVVIARFLAIRMIAQDESRSDNPSFAWGLALAGIRGTLRRGAGCGALSDRRIAGDKEFHTW